MKIAMLALFAVLLVAVIPLKATEKYDGLIKSAVCVHSVQKDGEEIAWHKARILAESSFDQRAYSPAGAMGLCQFIKPTADALGVDPWNPASAIPGMVRYTNEIARYYAFPDALDRTTKQMFTDAGYNWRMDRIRRMARAHGWSWEFLSTMMPAETRNYSPRIQRYKREFMRRVTDS